MADDLRFVPQLLMCHNRWVASIMRNILMEVFSRILIYVLIIQSVSILVFCTVIWVRFCTYIFALVNFDKLWFSSITFGMNFPWGWSYISRWEFRRLIIEQLIWLPTLHPRPLLSRRTHRWLACIDLLVLGNVTQVIIIWYFLLFHFRFGVDFQSQMIWQCRL